MRVLVNVDENIAIGSFVKGKDLGSASTDITRNIGIGKEAFAIKALQHSDNIAMGYEI